MVPYPGTVRVAHASWAAVPVALAVAAADPFEGATLISVAPCGAAGALVAADFEVTFSGTGGIAVTLELAVRVLAERLSGDAPQAMDTIAAVATTAMRRARGLTVQSHQNVL